jgi:hypothetical protein
MRRRITRLRPRPTAVVALLALVVALGGSAFAAHRYLITSKRQIKPSVRRALHGRRGVRGASGPSGPTGPTGAIGTQLPSGKSETGVFFAEGTASTVGDLAAASISFPVALSSAPTATIVSSGTTPACQGSVNAPTASPGNLCIYVGATLNVTQNALYDPFGGAGGTTSIYGAGLVADSAAAGNFYTDGSWAVTGQ